MGQSMRSGRHQKSRSGMGYLIVELMSQPPLTPVAYARINVESEETGVIQSLETDMCGRTKSIAVPAPPKQLSLNPNSRQPPYSRYTVTIEKEGFIAMCVTGVQVYETIESILPVIMAGSLDAPGENDRPCNTAQPQPFAEPPLQTENITTVPAQTQSTNTILQNVSSEDFQKDLLFNMPASPRSTKDTVQNSVYIPESIIVHMGAPSILAPNIKIPFADYIKNVASANICPTWPENSLRANIHAQIGFALNRIFTQWYPSRGYAFHITNSPAHDQGFTFGRNIFNNIGSIVNEIFNIYPHRKGSAIPLASASYSGLSPWGTVALANRGYNPLSILRYYYGNDVELSAINNIHGIAESWPGYLLQRNMQEEHIRLLQQQLNRIRQNFPYIPQISQDTGYFGPETEAAVRAFQEIFNERTDGLVGQATWYLVQRVHCAVTNQRELDTPVPYSATPYYPGKILGPGSTGRDIERMQKALSDLSGIYQVLPDIAVDGVYGPSTKRALLEFQRLFGLRPDGIYDPLSHAMLNKIWNDEINDRMQ